MCSTITTCSFFRRCSSRPAAHFLRASLLSAIESRRLGPRRPLLRSPPPRCTDLRLRQPCAWPQSPSWLGAAWVGWWQAALPARTGLESKQPALVCCHLPSGPLSGPGKPGRPLLCLYSWAPALPRSVDVLGIFSPCLPHYYGQFQTSPNIEKMIEGAPSFDTTVFISQAILFSTVTLRISHPCPYILQQIPDRPPFHP